jgi:hypothetical protein
LRPSRPYPLPFGSAYTSTMRTLHAMRSLLLFFLPSAMPVIHATQPVSTIAPSEISAAGSGLTGPSYANTTFTRSKTSANAASSSIAGGAATTQGIPRSTAYSTTTIPLPGGGLTTSTAYSILPPTTATSTSGPLILNHGAALAVPGMMFGVAWCMLAGAMVALLSSF